MAGKGGTGKRNDRRRGGGLRPLGPAVARVARPAIRRRGIAAASLITDWPRIVGPLLAGECWPVRLATPRSPKDGPAEGGVLHLRVAGPVALELQHLAPRLIERINAHFGYRAVASLRLVQGPPVGAAPPPAKTTAGASRATPDPDRLQRLLAGLSSVQDSDLRDSLEALGRGLAGRDDDHSRKPPADSSRQPASGHCAGAPDLVLEPSRRR